MRSLHIDIETYCEIDLKKAGAYRYAEDCEILLFAYAWDDEPVQVVDYISMEDIPSEVMQALTDPAVTKKAFNAAFEISCLKNYFNLDLKVEQWRDTQALVALCGLPLNLGDAATVLNIDQQKDKNGNALIKYFCVPIAKPIAKNGFRMRNLPQHDLTKWEAFKTYNGNDVEVERAISKALAFCQVSPFEQAVWALDQQINDRGVAVNVPFVRQAISLINSYEDRLVIEAKELTGLDNPKSVAQLKKWLFEQTDEEVESLNKESIPAILAGTDSEVVKRVLEIRQQGSKTSTKKYPAMMNALCKDGRLRGLHQYGGANRTMRAAGRMLQHQNLPRGKYKNIEPVRDMVMQNDPEWLEFVYGAIPDALSSLIRSALIPAPGHRFIILDYSAIEMVVTAFLAGEDWVLDVFRTHGKIYEMSASRMFNLPLESVTKESPYRQKGKITELGCSYGGSVGALTKMGALKEGILEEELPGLVRGWRTTHLNIVAFWKALQEAAMQAITNKTKVFVHEIYVSDVYVQGKIELDYFAPDHGIYFEVRGKTLFLGLPSGRELVYCNVGVEDGEYGLRIIFWGVDQTKKKWSKLDTYGPKFLENISQSVARDILMNGMQNLDRAGYQVVLHVHDEAVCETPIGTGSLEEVKELMLQLPSWCKDMPLKAAGEESLYYKK